MSDYKFRITLDITAKAEAEGKRFSAEDIMNSIRVIPHDTVDGFEIIPNLPGCDVASDFFLESADIVSINPVTEIDGFFDASFDDFRTKMKSCLENIIPVVMAQYEKQIAEEGDEYSYIVSLHRSKLPDGKYFDPWFKLDVFVDIACAHPAFDDCFEDGYLVVFHVNKEYATSYVSTLCTFPDDDAFYCKQFSVPREWLIRQISEEYDMTLEDFMDEYTWDQTCFIYTNAKNACILLYEEEVQ